jgi:hypothetical protein
MAEKNRPEDAHELIDEVTERVFINYEPPSRQNDSSDSEDSEEDAEQDSRAA